MERYAITARAGRFVAGRTNTGVGTILTLTEKQAEHELRLGTLVPADLPVQPVVAQEWPLDAPQGAVQPRGRKAAAKRAKAEPVADDASD